MIVDEKRLGALGINPESPGSSYDIHPNDFRIVDLDAGRIALMASPRQRARIISLAPCRGIDVSVRWDDKNRAALALECTFEPFGSLRNGCPTAELSRLLVEYADGSDCYSEILAAVRATRCYRQSAAVLGQGDSGVITPTSGTIIGVSAPKMSSGSVWRIRCVFPTPSFSRAAEISAALARNNFPFGVEWADE